MLIFDEVTKVDFARKQETAAKLAEL